MAGGREDDDFMAGGREDERPGREDDRLVMAGRDDDRFAAEGRREVDRRGAVDFNCFFLAAPSGIAYGYCGYTTRSIKFAKKFAVKTWATTYMLRIVLRN